MNKPISYSEYVAESINKSIEYSEYIAQQIDSNLSWADYLGEQDDEVKNLEKMKQREAKIDKIFNENK
jgi:hypothetical protein